jgi:hypothetical protein
MANKNKISIKPMNNAAAIASTLGISPFEPKEETILETVTKPEKTPTVAKKEKNVAYLPKKSDSRENRVQLAKDKNTVSEKVSDLSGLPTQETNTTVILPIAANLPVTEMPLLIDIKRKFPGKELYILSLLYLQRNGRGLVQMTVGNMMALYSSVFLDVIKDDTVRRSLKRLSDAGVIKTTGIPGNNSGYIYEIGDLLENELLSAEEREEFAELTRFVKSKLG